MALATRSELFLSYILLPQRTVNMTLPPSLITNGHQLGSSEYVISHCPLKTEFCMRKRACLIKKYLINTNIISRFLTFLFAVHLNRLLKMWEDTLVG